MTGTNSQTTICHICGVPNNKVGRSICSAAHSGPNFVPQTTPKCWCLACSPKDGEIGLDCQKDKQQTTYSDDPYYNLIGAMRDLEKQKADPLCIKTIGRVIDQIYAMQKVLGDKP